MNKLFVLWPCLPPVTVSPLQTHLLFFLSTLTEATHKGGSSWKGIWTCHFLSEYKTKTKVNTSFIIRHMQCKKSSTTYFVHTFCILLCSQEENVQSRPHLGGHRSRKYIAACSMAVHVLSVIFKNWCGRGKGDDNEFIGGPKTSDVEHRPQWVCKNCFKV